jgi:hypothetical protein
MSQQYPCFCSECEKYIGTLSIGWKSLVTIKWLTENNEDKKDIYTLILECKKLCSECNKETNDIKIDLPTLIDEEGNPPMVISWFPSDE